MSILKSGKHPRKEEFMTKNQLQYWAQKEQARSNRQNEFETNRHNVATERLSDLQYQEGRRHNLAGEGETHRSNVANENIRQNSNAIQQGILSENIRHNRAQEQTNLLSVSETKRANQAREAETHRSNVRGEALTQSGLRETRRHNTESENIQIGVANQNLANNLLGHGLRFLTAFNPL